VLNFPFSFLHVGFARYEYIVYVVVLRLDSVLTVGSYCAQKHKDPFLVPLISSVGKYK